MTSRWCTEARAKLAAMEDLVAQGRGAALIEGGGCAEPGGGIVATQRSARDTAALLRQQIAQTCGAPEAPPPFGSPAGHVGGSYDWWWWNFGRAGGHPYAPPESVSRGGRPAAGFGVGAPDFVSGAVGLGYFVVGAAVLGLAAYGGWVLWRR